MATRDTESDAEQLRADLEQIKQDIAALTNTLKGLAADRGHQGMDALKSAAAGTEQQAKAAVQSVENQISERPFVSVLMAFGFGLLVGKLLDR